MIADSLVEQTLQELNSEPGSVSYAITYVPLIKAYRVLKITYVVGAQAQGMSQVASIRPSGTDHNSLRGALVDALKLATHERNSSQ